LGSNIAELAQVQFAMDVQDFLIAQVGILHDRKRQCSHSIRSDRRKIDQCSCQKPARLDQYCGDQGLLDDPHSFARGFPTDDTLDDGPKHHPDQDEIREILHHIPKFPQGSIQMEERSVY